MTKSRGALRRSWIMRRVPIVALLTFLGTSPPAAAADPLELSEVLASALRAHPKMAILDAKVDAADAERMRARGAFDLKATAEGMFAPVGTYERPYGELGLKQATTAWGLEFYGKYQNGADFAPYDGAFVTSEAGKVSLGALLPLLQGGAIDKARYERAKADLELTIAKESQRGERAELLASAARSWWKWVVSGKKLKVYRDLLRQAAKRRDFLREQANAGSIAPIEVTDNERLLAARQAQLAALELEFRRVSLKLGLYRRGPDETPLPAQETELPEQDWWQLDVRAPEAELRASLEEAPALQVYKLSVEVMDRELSLANNERLPELNLELFSSHSFGETRPYSSTSSSVTETALGGRVSFAWDVQQRKARGKSAVISAKRRAVEQEARLLRDQLSVEVDAQLAALSAMSAAAELSRTATRRASEVNEAERTSFEAGQSSVLAVNLREQAVLSATIAELDAIYEYQLARIELQRLVGEDRPEAYLPPPAIARPQKEGGT